eukprot:gene2692-900_t
MGDLEDNVYENSDAIYENDTQNATYVNSVQNTESSLQNVPKTVKLDQCKEINNNSKDSCFETQNDSDYSLLILPSNSVDLGEQYVPYPGDNRLAAEDEYYAEVKSPTQEQNGTKGTKTKEPKIDFVCDETYYNVKQGLKALHDATEGDVLDNKFACDQTYSDVNEISNGIREDCVPDTVVTSDATYSSINEIQSEYEVASVIGNEQPELYDNVKESCTQAVEIPPSQSFHSEAALELCSEIWDGNIENFYQRNQELSENSSSQKTYLLKFAKAIAAFLLISVSICLVCIAVLYIATPSTI